MTNLQTIVKYASLNKAQDLLLKEDLFTNSWSMFDVDSRMGKSGSTKAELLQHIKEQVREWSDKEKTQLSTIIASIDTCLQAQQLHLSYPKEIYLIKSTMLEEGGAMGYTRGNYIVLNEVVCTKPAEKIQKLITHELFHVLTRHNTDFKKSMYHLIGFQLMNSIDYPKTLKELRITNPDAPQTDSYITLKINDKSVDCMMVLYANKPYEGGRFFDYLQSGFMALTPSKEVAYKNDEPIVYTLNEVANFFEQVGRNTNYIIHPEEILADNFAFTVLGKEALSDA